MPRPHAAAHYELSETEKRDLIKRIWGDNKLILSSLEPGALRNV